MPKIVLFDVDGTLISEATAGETSRPLFFPKTTAEVMKTLVSAGDRIIIASSAAKKVDIEAALRAAGIIDVAKIDILGKKEVNDIQIEGEGNTRISGAQAKVKYAEKQRQTMPDMKGVIIVEDDCCVESTDTVVHILVPTNGASEIPPSDSYLTLVNLPFEYLKEKVTQVVQAAKLNSQNDDTIDAGALDEVYARIVREHFARQALKAEIVRYKTDNPYINANPPVAVKSGFFGKLSMSKKDRDMSRLQSDLLLLDAVANGKMDHNVCMASLKNEPLKGILRDYYINTVENMKPPLNPSRKQQ